MQELKKILEEIEQKIEKAEKIIVKPAHDKLDEIANDTAEAFIEAYKECQDIIRKYMENDGWIPVEKDLPKNGSEVWVVLESTYGTGYRTYSIARYLYFENYGESHWLDRHYGYLEWDKYSDGHGGCSKYKVIAWQPIEPYRPERSKNDSKRF